MRAGPSPLAVCTVAGEVGLYFTLVALAVAAHFAYVAYLVVGGFVALRWPKTVWAGIHLPLHHRCDLPGQLDRRGRGGGVRRGRGLVDVVFAACPTPANHIILTMGRNRQELCSGVRRSGAPVQCLCASTRSVVTMMLPGWSPCFRRTRRIAEYLRGAPHQLSAGRDPDAAHTGRRL
jgi:hypothetical protein